MSRLACRLLGHRYRFGAEGADLVWRCRRGCGTGGRRTYSDDEEARFYARRLARGAPGPPTGLLVALAGSVTPMRRAGGR